MKTELKKMVLDDRYGVCGEIVRRLEASLRVAGRLVDEERGVK